MSVATCKHCEETIMTPPMETYYVHTRTMMAQCGIRYATPVNPTADETKDLSDWTEFDLQELADGLNGIEKSGGEVDKTLVKVTDEPLTSEILSEGSDISASGSSDVLPESECNHLWLNKAGTEYRLNPVEVCAKCGEER